MESVQFFVNHCQNYWQKKKQTCRVFFLNTKSFKIKSSKNHLRCRLQASGCISNTIYNLSCSSVVIVGNVGTRLDKWMSRLKALQHLFWQCKCVSLTSPAQTFDTWWSSGQTLKSESLYRIRTVWQPALGVHRHLSIMSWSPCHYWWHRRIMFVIQRMNAKWCLCQS